MSLKIVGLSEINGPLVALDGIHGAGYEEMVELELQDGTTRTGRIVQMDGDRCIIQVFEGTRGLSLQNTTTTILGHPVEMSLSKELLGRVLNGSGRPIDGLGEIYWEKKEDIHHRCPPYFCFALKAYSHWKKFGRLVGGRQARSVQI